MSVVLLLVLGVVAFGCGLLVAGALHLLAAMTARACIEKAKRKRAASAALAWSGRFVRDNSGGQ